MSALAHYVRIQTTAGVVLHDWQNHWTGTADFFPFTLGEIRVGTDGGDDAASLTLPLMPVTLMLADQGIRNQYLVTITSYRYDPVAPAARTRIAGYYGQIVGAEIGMTSISLSIGCAVDAVEAQVPARVFTTALVGTPPKR